MDWFLLKKPYKVYFIFLNVTFEIFLFVLGVLLKLKE